MSKKLLFIVNPKAGRTRSAAPLFEAAASFGEAGWMLSIRRTQGPGHAVEMVSQEGGAFDAIVCCGGDGTLNEVVRGAMTLDNPPPNGYIPEPGRGDLQRPALCVRGFLRGLHQGVLQRAPVGEE